MTDRSSDPDILDSASKAARSEEKWEQVCTHKHWTASARETLAGEVQYKLKQVQELTKDELKDFLLILQAAGRFYVERTVEQHLNGNQDLHSASQKAPEMSATRPGYNQEPASSLPLMTGNEQAEPAELKATPKSNGLGLQTQAVPCPVASPDNNETGPESFRTDRKEESRLDTGSARELAEGDGSVESPLGKRGAVLGFEALLARQEKRNEYRRSYYRKQLQFSHKRKMHLIKNYNSSLPGTLSPEQRNQVMDVIIDFLTFIKDCDDYRREYEQRAKKKKKKGMGDGDV